MEKVQHFRKLNFLIFSFMWDIVVFLDPGADPDKKQWFQ